MADALFHLFGELAQVEMAGHDVVPGVGHPDQGAFQVLVAVSHGLEQGPHLGPAGRFEYVFAAPTHYLQPPLLHSGITLR
jgi:hypothetical protein